MIDQGVANCNREARAEFPGMPVGRTRDPPPKGRLFDPKERRAGFEGTGKPFRAVCPYGFAVGLGVIASSICFSALAKSAKFFWLSTAIIFS